MGCGCSKNRNTRRKIVSNKSSKVKKIKTNNKKINICLSCSFSIQTKEERKKSIKICHKKNRLIYNIIRDKNFKCPINKF
jgi:hypothetical protein